MKSMPPEICYSAWSSVRDNISHEDPGSYHIYYGDELGRPGTIMTFFAWPGGIPGRIGAPQVTATSFAIPQGALEYWSARLAEYGVKPESPAERFGDAILQFVDHDGLQLEMVATAIPDGQPWNAGPVPTEYAIRGFHSVTIAEEGYESTATVLHDVGFQSAGNEQNRFRYRAAAAEGFASTVDLLCVPDARQGSMGTGVVHHVAFRTPDRPQQDDWRRRIVEAGMNFSPVMDRTYFQSIYYREPGGVLFEIATDGPGFTSDESVNELGSKLMLPEQLQPQRSKIERIVPQVRLPAGASVGGGV
jgi:catechol 2,3-dioxygenase-like lactoylglutathione lyase family enzyme